VTTKTPSLLLVGAPDPSRDALGQILADAGYALSTAESNEDAFHKIQSGAPATGPPICWPIAIS